MIIWILAIFILALMAWIGSGQGAIKSAFTFFGLILASILANPLGRLLTPVVKSFGLHYPILNDFVGPIFAFFLVAVVVEIFSAGVDQKVKTARKYQRNGLSALLFQRMNNRVGICMGVLNGIVLYLLLLVPIYLFGYLLVQMGPSEAKLDRFLISGSEQIQKSGLDRVVTAIDHVPATYYDAADVLGLVYTNPALHNRLSRYPIFLNLGNRPEFGAIAADAKLNNDLYSQAKFREILASESIQGVVTNAEITSELKLLLREDLKDLRQYLETGKSPKYEEDKVLGYWVLDVEGTVNAEKSAKANITSVDIKRIRSVLRTNYPAATLTATTDGVTVLRSEVQQPATVLSKGTWSKEGDNFKISLPRNGKPETADATVVEESKRLLLTKDGMKLVFNRER